MKTKNLISTGKVMAISIIVLGFIHIAATYSPLIKGGLYCLDEGNLYAMLYMSLMCGASFILSGTILLLLLKQIEKHTFLVSSMMVIGIFLAINGILSVIYMNDNPFAWLAMFVNASMFLIILVLRTRVKKN